MRMFIICIKTSPWRLFVRSGHDWRDFLTFFSPSSSFVSQTSWFARRLVGHCCHGSGRGGREGAVVAVAPRSVRGDGVPQHGNPAAPGQPTLLSRCQQCQRVPLPDGPLLWGDRLLHILLWAVVWVQFIFTYFGLRYSPDLVPRSQKNMPGDQLNFQMESVSLAKRPPSWNMNMLERW